MQHDSSPPLPMSHTTERTLGERLRSLRTRHGLSQRELAKRAHVTNSTISQVEQDAVSPSVSSLNKILDVFPISLSDFFGDEIPEPPARILRGAEHEQAQECATGMTLQHLAPWPTSGDHETLFPNLSLGSLTPGTSVGLQASHDALLVVTQGCLRIEIPGTGSEPLDTRLRPDDAVRLFAGERYRLHHVIDAPEVSASKVVRPDLKATVDRSVTGESSPVGNDDTASDLCRWVSMSPVR